MKTIIGCLIITVLGLLSACGGAGGDQNPTPSGGSVNTPEASIGTFGACDGIQYSTIQGKSGITSNGGRFEYVPDADDEVYFYIGEIILGHGLAQASMDLDDMADDPDVARRMDAFLTALDDDTTDGMKRTITEDVRINATVDVDFTLNDALFIRVYAGYAEHLAGFTANATGDIGQDSDTFFISIAVGEAVFFPVMDRTGFMSSDPSIAYPVAYPELEDGVFVVGIAMGEITFRITGAGYPLTFTIEVTPSDYPDDFTGTRVVSPNANPVITHGVWYSDYVDSLPDLSDPIVIVNEAVFLREREGI